MTFTELSYETEGHVGIVTLRRPEAMNSLSYTLYMELEDAIRVHAPDAAVNATLPGAGPTRTCSRR